jgi:hypothetical protein
MVGWEVGAGGTRGPAGGGVVEGLWQGQDGKVVPSLLWVLEGFPAAADVGVAGEEIGLVGAVG